MFGIKDKVLMENNNLFTMHHSGRNGRITYQAGNSKVEIYWEMSGSVEYDILLAPIDLKEWDEPKGIAIPLKKQIEILHELRSWTIDQKLRTDIDLPMDLSFEDIACAWVGCSENRIKGSAYCSMHYDENLLRK